ncbi:ribosomal RNA small subunit methyltransferase A [Candidatus Gracilibacteria bacterium]|nr:ribosomal RNA small subunit methyltransferase A [Candidatus Gracilibacteria bacterium]
MSQEILDKYHIRAKKSLGQNFLVDTNLLDQISLAGNIEGDDIIEVGPGYGALTEKLIDKSPKSLTLIELDKDMISVLEERISFSELDFGDTKYEIVNQDILQYEPSLENYKVIANIPYYITSPILRHFLYEVSIKPNIMLILMQKDVGDKILRKNKGKSSVLSLIVEKKCRVSENILVPKESFIPQPKVESSVLRFETHTDYSEIDDDNFLRIIKIGFSEARKKLIKNLVKGGIEKDKILEFYSQNNFSENTRAEELDIRQWCDLIKTI